MSRRSTPRVALALLAVLAGLGCDAREAPPPPEPEEEATPDLRLASDAWPVWAPALQVDGCREEARALRALVDEAGVDPRLAHQARRRLRELEVCLDRRRVSLEVVTDTVYSVELELDAPPALLAALEARRSALRACATDAPSSPDGTARLHLEVGDRGRAESVSILQASVPEEVAACLRRQVEAAPLEGAPGPMDATLTVRAGGAFTRPCVRDRHAPPARLRVTEVRAPAEDEAGRPWDADGSGPDLHVFLYYRGTRLTSVLSEDAASFAPTDDPRAAIRCPVAVSEERPLGVLVVEFDDGRDRVVGWGESALDAAETTIEAGPARITLERIPTP